MSKIQQIARYLYQKLFSVDYMLLEWNWEHERKTALLRNELLESAIKKLGYKLETTLKADYFVDGDLPKGEQDGPHYKLIKINDEQITNT